MPECHLTSYVDHSRLGSLVKLVSADVDSCISWRQDADDERPIIKDLDMAGIIPLQQWLWGSSLIHAPGDGLVCGAVHGAVQEQISALYEFGLSGTDHDIPHYGY